MARQEQVQQDERRAHTFELLVLMMERIEHDEERHSCGSARRWLGNKKEGASRAGAVTRTQQQAIERAVGQAKRERVEVVIHRKDGSIRDSDSYGNDPNPPKDRKN